MTLGPLGATMTRRWYLAAWVLVALPLLACSSDPIEPPVSDGLIPLAVGYSWAYRWTDGRGAGFETDSVVAHQVVNGIDYFRIEGPVLGALAVPGGQAWFRNHGVGRFILLSGEPPKEYVIFDSDAAVDSSWTLDNWVLVGREEDFATLSVPAGNFEEVPVFCYGCNIYDNARRLAVVGGLGIARQDHITFGGLITHSLYKVSQNAVLEHGS